MCYLPSSYVKNIFCAERWVMTQTGQSFGSVQNDSGRYCQSEWSKNFDPSWSISILRDSKISIFKLCVTSNHYNSFKKFDWILFPLSPICYNSGISRSVICGKNPKFIFWSLMTWYIADYLWRHMNLKLHQLGYLYATWHKSRDVISVRYHVMKKITPEKPETELASFLEKKSRRVWEGLGVSFLGKLSKKGFFGY